MSFPPELPGPAQPAEQGRMGLAACPALAFHSQALWGHWGTGFCGWRGTEPGLAPGGPGSWWWSRKAGRRQGCETGGPRPLVTAARTGRWSLVPSGPAGQSGVGALMLSRGATRGLDWGGRTLRRSTEIPAGGHGAWTRSGRTLTECGLVDLWAVGVGQRGADGPGLCQAQWFLSV